MPKCKNSIATFWLIFKHCDMVGWFWKKNKKTINRSVDCYYWIQSYFCDAGFWWIGKLSEPFTTKFVFPDSKDSNQFLHWKCTLKKWFTLKKNASTLFENYSKCRIWIFELWHFPTIFVPLKVTCLVTLFDRKLQIFKNSPK